MFRICNLGCLIGCLHHHFPKIDDFVSKSKLLLIQFIKDKSQKSKSDFEMDIFISIIKSEFNFFQMEIKSGFRDAVELSTLIR